MALMAVFSRSAWGNDAARARPFPAPETIQGAGSNRGGHWTDRVEHRTGQGGSIAVGAVLALAAVGTGALLVRRRRSGVGAGPLRVVGRVRLTASHEVWLLRVGEAKTLIVGLGRQGPPALLGELGEPIASDLEPNTETGGPA